MKIESNFYEDYDFLQSYRDSLIYKRFTDTEPVAKDDLKGALAYRPSTEGGDNMDRLLVSNRAASLKSNYPDDYSSPGIEAQYFVICGKVYVLLTAKWVPKKTDAFTHKPENVVVRRLWKSDVDTTKEFSLFLNVPLGKPPQLTDLSFEKLSSNYLNVFRNQGVFTSDMNDKYNCPVISFDSQLNTKESYGKHELVVTMNPKLREWGFNLVSPEILFQEISMWLSSRRGEVPSPQTNLEKIVSHGFDKKTSFRHPKK